MNLEKDQRAYIYWRLGKEGIPFDQVGPMLGYAVKAAKGFERGFYPVPGTALRVFWDPGMDGLDGWYGLED